MSYYPHRRWQAAADVRHAHRHQRAKAGGRISRNKPEYPTDAKQRGRHTRYTPARPGRIEGGDDFPYFVQNGFPEDFLLMENALIERTGEGLVCRDKDGNVRLECTCGLIIAGKTDPANPLCTTGGSCWTNDSSPLLDIPSDEDPWLQPRNRCIHQGYASMARCPFGAMMELLT